MKHTLAQSKTREGEEEAQSNLHNEASTPRGQGQGSISNLGPKPRPTTKSKGPRGESHLPAIPGLEQMESKPKPNQPNFAGAQHGLSPEDEERTQHKNGLNPSHFGHRRAMARAHQCRLPLSPTLSRCSVATSSS
jgi:hypothetical protein